MASAPDKPRGKGRSARRMSSSDDDSDSESSASASAPKSKGKAAASAAPAAAGVKQEPMDLSEDVHRPLRPPRQRPPNVQAILDVGFATLPLAHGIASVGLPCAEPCALSALGLGFHTAPPHMNVFRLSQTCLSAWVSCYAEQHWEELQRECQWFTLLTC